MKVGTKSLLFGIHQFIWHPIVVAKAWRYLYDERPTWREMICIIIHDWGYWGKRDLDHIDGATHPALGGKIADRLFGPKYGDLCRGHSRTYSKMVNMKPSKLCWADKLSFCFEPKWFYMFRIKMSGELDEIICVSIQNGLMNPDSPIDEWYENFYTYILEQPEIKKLLDKKYYGKGE